MKNVANNMNYHNTKSTYMIPNELTGKLNIDYFAIKEYVTTHDYDFQNLIQRFEKNDTLLTQEELAMIYYGYSFTSAYTEISVIDDYCQFQKLEEAKDEKAYELGKSILKRNPVSLKTLLKMYLVADILEKDDAEIRSYAQRYYSLLGMIAATGDGKTEKTAFKVIDVDDEYHILYKQFEVENIKKQSFIKLQYDVFDFEQSLCYNGTRMYFDISRPLEREQQNC